MTLNPGFFVTLCTLLAVAFGFIASHGVKVAQIVAQSQLFLFRRLLELVFMSFGGVVQRQRQAT